MKISLVLIASIFLASNTVLPCHAFDLGGGNPLAGLLSSLTSLLKLGGGGSDCPPKECQPKPPACEPVKCPENQVWTMGHECGKTCLAMNEELADICKRARVMQYESCWCKDGMVLNPNTKECISVKECEDATKPEPKKCSGPHEHYCPKKGDCVCDDGYMRSAVNGQCVKIQKNPESCPANEVARNVPGDYDDRCADLRGNKAKGMCAFTDVVRCVCVDNYCRDSTGKCVQENKCSGPHEHYCPKKGDCVCDDGYMRAGNGQCIKIKANPESCPTNEVAAKVPGDYDDRCPSLRGNTAKGMCAFSDVTRCVCLSGYYRNANNKCVPKKDCP